MAKAERLPARLLEGADRESAIKCIEQNHYTHSVPSGKSYYYEVEGVLVIFSIPANKNIAQFLLGPYPLGKKFGEWNVWELSRLWAPDGHSSNLLTRALRSAVKAFADDERPSAIVSYADPNVGHHGGVYRAASWIYHGKSEETRVYRDRLGQSVARRAFHSGGKGMTKAQIEKLGYIELKLAGKERFVKPITGWAKKILRGKSPFA